MGRELSKIWKKQLLCIGGGLVLCGAAYYGEQAEDNLRQGYLEREAYGRDGKTYEFLVDGIYEEPLACRVEISSLQYTKEEAEAVFEELAAGLPQMILGENQSLDQVWNDLELKTLFDDIGVRAVWKSREPEIIDSFGRINREHIPEEGAEVLLDVVLTDGVHEKETQISVKARPPRRTPEEQVIRALEEQICRSDSEGRQERYVVLPREYEGKPIRYRKKGSRTYLFLPLLGVIMAALLARQEKSKEEKKKKHRKQQLLLDYADVIYQLMVYLGAGLTVGKAWEQIVRNYEKKRERTGEEPRPVYEEMALTLSQMQYGIPEGAAISQFGKRCQHQCYIKLSSLLEQNRKTGTKNLNQLLEQEMTTAWEEQKHAAKRMGEEARTKLMAPLFLMLIVVMVIIMVPAVMAMG